MNYYGSLVIGTGDGSGGSGSGGGGTTVDAYSKVQTDALLFEKADKDTTYNKTEVDNIVGEKADADNVYTKNEVDEALGEKADADNVYTKTEVDTALNGKVDSNTLNEAIDEINGVVGEKADADNVYTKTEVDTALGTKANADSVYTKAETDKVVTDKVTEIVAGAPEDFDTLQEMSAWMLEHADSAAEMNLQIQNNKTAVEELEEADEAKTTELGVIKNEVAINKTTLGYQSKNLFNMTLTSQTKAGITYTINDDKSITINGTQTQISDTTYLTIGTFTAPYAGKYILTGYPDGDTWVDISLGYMQWGATVIRDLNYTFSVAKGTVVTLMLCVKAGATVSNRTFKPMIRSADIIDATYEPYKPSVDERIESVEQKIDGVEAQVGESEWTEATLNNHAVAYDDSNKPAYKKVGNAVYLTGVIKPSSDTNSFNTSNGHTIFTLPDGYRPSRQVTVLCQGTMISTWLLTINTNGAVVASRYRQNISTAVGFDETPPPTTTWMPFSTSFAL